MLDENIFINVKCVKTIFQHLGILKGPPDENMMKETLVYPMWNVYKWIFHSWKPKSTSDKTMKQRDQGLILIFLHIFYNSSITCAEYVKHVETFLQPFETLRSTSDENIICAFSTFYVQLVLNMYVETLLQPVETLRST